jgi:hypothetical protein
MAHRRCPPSQYRRAQDEIWKSTNKPQELSGHDGFMKGEATKVSPTRPTENLIILEGIGT